ncbi:MAG TPA: carboxy terminal-processing peptidase [Isosphaeraceae bacterium]|jgi:carboxyl-terminal processing protease|nr:carboxy terminal-processing peptidase [Isosphaeraceae bacterium]
MAQFSLRRPGGIAALVGGLAALAMLLAAQAPAPNPKEADKLTARIVVDLLERDHISKPDVDDKLAKLWCRNFLEALDPQKVYFLKADIEEFLAKDTTLDDAARKGDLGFAREVFDRFLKRHDERYKDQLELLKEKHDFDADEAIADDPKEYDWPADAKEARERWRKRVKLDLLQDKVDKVEPDEAQKKLARRYKERNKFWHDMDSADLLEIYLTSLTTAVDPHSSYLSARSWEDLLQTLQLKLEGIGASLASEDGFAVVKEIIPGAPADKDGRLQPEDKIVAIEKDGETIDLVERRLSDVVRYIRGPRGTKVRLVVQKGSTKERAVYELTRDKVELKDAHAKGQVVEAKVDDGKSLKIGVIDLPSFYGDSDAQRRHDPNAVSATHDCRDLLAGFKKQKVDAVLIDLRRNGGGLLSEAIDLSGLFIDKGPVVQVRDPDTVEVKGDNDEGTAWDGPMAVLISHQSASASEIFAGVIKDYRRGLIIGDSSTFGKGTVQSIVVLNERLRRGLDLPPMGALKLTIQQFYRANGESTQIKGVKPDIHIPSILDQIEALSEGKMDHAMKFDKIEPQPHDLYNKVPADLVARLEARSWDRRKASDKFKKQDERIQQFVDRKAKHEIPLNEAKYRAQVIDFDEDDADADPNAPHSTKKDKPRKRFVDRPAWESTFYNDEVIAIVRDYLTLGSDALAHAPAHAAR